MHDDYSFLRGLIIAITFGLLGHLLALAYLGRL
jgi:hypothetical protein